MVPSQACMVSSRQHQLPNLHEYTPEQESALQRCMAGQAFLMKNRTRNPENPLFFKKREGLKL
jgi:hypothetical protein